MRTNIFEEGELRYSATAEEFSVVRQEGRRQVQRKMTLYNIDATSIDYDPKAESSKEFFKIIQNKMHWAAHANSALLVIKKY